MTTVAPEHASKKDKTPINRVLDEDLRRMMRMNPDFARTVHDIGNALLSNVEIEWPADSDPGALETRALMDDIYVQLCTHGIVATSLVILPNRDPMKHRLHVPHVASAQRFHGHFYFANPFSVYWSEEEDNPYLSNKALFAYRLPTQTDPMVGETSSVAWEFNGWLSKYLDKEIQLRSMANSAFRGFIRSSEGFLRRRLDIAELIKGMPDSRMSRDVENFLKETPEMHGQVVLPQEFAAQMSFARAAATANPPNTPGWPHTNVVPTGMVEEVTMPNQIGTTLLTEDKRELYTSIIESHTYAAAHIRQVIEAALIYFYNAFLRKDRYEYYVMLEARRQVETVCQYVEKKLKFEQVEYWLILPRVPPADERALLMTLGMPVPSELADPTEGDSMNPQLEAVVNRTRQKRARKDAVSSTTTALALYSNPNNIRNSPTLAAALAKFIVPAFDPHSAAGAVPVFKWGAVKNILPEEESNGTKRKPGTGTTSVVH